MIDTYESVGVWLSRKSLEEGWVRARCGETARNTEQVADQVRGGQASSHPLLSRRLVC